jgi:hypothetical protein
MRENVMPVELLQFLAQSGSSDFGDFMDQIGGLLVLTCGAGVLWLGLMAIIMQRAAERRRRAEKGLPPLPALHVSVYRAVMKWINPETGSAPAPTPSPAAMTGARAPAPAAKPAVPVPDLTMLTSDLPEPDLAAMFPDPEPEEEPPPDDVWEDAGVEQEPVEDDMAAEYPPLAEASPGTAPGDMPPDSVELLRVWRDLANGALIVEIGGQRFESVEELQRADLERRFLNVMRDLDSMARQSPASPSASPSAPPSARRAPAAKDQDPDEGPPSLSPGAMLRQMTRVAMGQAPEPVEEVPDLSIADQIEAVLQAQLADLPEFDQRDIHVRPSPEGGVRIEVDGQFYDGVGEVDDSDVRDLLADVVREWEANQ